MKGLSIALLLTLFGFVVQGAELVELKTEYTKTPLGIDIAKPRFSWMMNAERNGAHQKAYQIIVMNEHGEKVWDSIKMLSGISLNIKYNGSTLKPSTRYLWRLKVWDEVNHSSTADSWFETGLMNTSQLAWQGATWIGGSEEDLTFYPHYLPVFKMAYDVQLDEQSRSVKAGFIYGANDERLMDRNKNIYQLEHKMDESYLMIEIDIAPLVSKGSAFLNIYRVGYHPKDDKNIPLKSYAISADVINLNNQYQKHRVSITSDLGHTVIFINQKQVAKLGTNPLGQGGDFTAFPVIGDIGYQVSANQKAIFSAIEIRNFRSPFSVLSQEGGTIAEGGNIGSFITHYPGRNSTPMLRSAFDLNLKIKKARLYVTSMEKG